MNEAPRIFVVHALEASLAPVARAFEEGWPEAKLANVMDDSLSADRAAGKTVDFLPRFRALADYCVNNGADGILFACSAFNAEIESCRRALSLPVLKPDEAMIEAALERGGQIAVVATFEPSIGSLKAQILSVAAARGMRAEVQGIFVPGAMDALKSGDGEKHDGLIAESAASVTRADTLLLAQFSMARAQSAARAATRVPVLTSPASAVAKLRSLVSS
ncbi:MAG: aspartate/glutamate racemase family protein [Gammaproteobacteria bacterium]|nr:aspartate/glutamate racemase family protein [Gammaproteobacteria bacterium]